MLAEYLLTFYDAQVIQMKTENGHNLKKHSTTCGSSTTTP